MGRVINTRRKLAEFREKRGTTRTKAYARALGETGGVSPYSLAANLTPSKGVKKIQSGSVRQLAHKAFRGPRAR